MLAVDGGMIMQAVKNGMQKDWGGLVDKSAVSRATHPLCNSREMSRPARLSPSPDRPMTLARSLWCGKAEISSFRITTAL